MRAAYAPTLFVVNTRTLARRIYIYLVDTTGNHDRPSHQMFVSGLVVLGFASLGTSLRVAHEQRRSVPTGWEAVRRAEPDIVLPLGIALTQPNMDKLEAYLIDVAHPDSLNYGKHWTPAEVSAAFRPPEEAVDAVRDWLVEDGSIDANRVMLSKSGGWITLNTTVEEAEYLLDTEYYVYEHADGRTHIACRDSYYLPEHVSKHVDLVTPTLHFIVKPARYARSGGSIAPLMGEKINVGITE